MSGATDPPAEGLGWVVRHRPLSGGRWKVIAEVDTHAEAVRCIVGAGDWWIGRAVAEPKTARKPKAVLAAEATPSLFS